MYSFVSATLLRNGRGKIYESVDISLVLLSSVYRDFKDGHIVLLNATISPNPLYVDLRALRESTVPFYNVAFETWLQAISNTVLPTLVTEPVYSSERVVYRDAVQAGYSVNAVDPLHPIGNPYECHYTPYVPEDGTATALFVTKPNISYTEMFDYLLFTVNGFCHSKTASNVGVLINDGVPFREYAGQTHVGIISFKSIGVITEHLIQSDWVHPLKPYAGFKEGILLETGLDLTGKSVIISIAGYLHVMDTTYNVINDATGTIVLNIGRIEWIRRLLDMQSYIDISKLGLSKSARARNAFSVVETHSDAFYRALLNLSQSFIIVVDTPRMGTSRITLGKTGIDGLYDSAVEPSYPVLHHTGRFQEQWCVNEAGRWTVHLDDGKYREYLYESSPWLLDSVVNATIDADGIRDSVVQMLSIHTSLRDGI